MLDLRHDFGFSGKLFGVPRKFLSQVAAFCKSFTVTGGVLKVRIPAFPDPENNPIQLWLDEDELAAFAVSSCGERFADKNHTHNYAAVGHTHSEYASADHTHSGYALEGHTHSNYAVSNHVHSEYANKEHQHAADDISGLADAVSSAVTAWSNSQGFDGKYASKTLFEKLVQEINDADYLTASDIHKSSLDAGKTASFNVVTDVVWTGTVLQKKSRAITVTNGIITGVGNEATATIDTPVLFESK